MVSLTLEHIEERKRENQLFGCEAANQTSTFTILAQTLTSRKPLTNQHCSDRLKSRWQAQAWNFHFNWKNMFIYSQRSKINHVKKQAPSEDWARQKGHPYSLLQGCMTGHFLGSCNTHICSPQWVRDRPKCRYHQGPPGQVLLGLLIGMRGNCIMKAHPSMGDSSQKLGPWSTLHSPQAVHQVGKCTFQVTQFV